MLERAIFFAGLVLIAMIVNHCAYDRISHTIEVQWREGGTIPSLADGAPHPGLAGALVGIHGDILVIAGGANFPDSMPWDGGRKRYHRDVYKYIRRDDGYHLLDMQPEGLPFPVAYGASCSTSKGVLYAGGENEGGFLSDVLLARFDSSSGRVFFDTLPPLPTPLANGAIACDGTTVYLAGGETAEGQSDQFLYLDLSRQDACWTPSSALPRPVSHAVLLIGSNGDEKYVCLLGGRAKDRDGLTQFFDSNLQFNPRTGQWIEKAPLPYKLAAGTGYALGAHLFLFGGDRGETFNKTERLLREIAGEADPLKKNLLIARKNEVQRRHPGFSREVLAYHVTADKWSVIGVIPFEAPVTTTIAGTDTEVLLPSGEIRAGVRTPRIIRGTVTFDSKNEGKHRDGQ